MKFRDFVFTDRNYFVAMEYYWLILNRTFLVLLTDESLIGIKVNGIVGVESNSGGVAGAVAKKYAIKGDLNDPASYINPGYIQAMQDCDLSEDSILSADKSNFIIKRADIRNASYDPRKKWGMGYYPHDGKVYVQTFDGHKKELIVLGDQSGHHIANLIMTR